MRKTVKPNRPRTGVGTSSRSKSTKAMQQIKRFQLMRNGGGLVGAKKKATLPPKRASIQRRRGSAMDVVRETHFQRLVRTSKRISRKPKNGKR